jgi:hypothetical protein
MEAEIANLNCNIDVGRERRDRPREAVERTMNVADEPDHAR